MTKNENTKSEKSKARIKLNPKSVRTIAVILAAIVILTMIFHGRTVMGNRNGLENIYPDWSNLNTENTLYEYNDSANKIKGVIGVDVSSHQGEIDWNKLADAGVKYAMIRAAYRGYETGALVSDTLYKQNISNARKAGIDVGVYIFSQAISETEAEEEADFLLELIKGQVVTYPIVYDLEHYTQSSARTDDLTSAQATANAVAFCRKIESKGYTPMIYLNKAWMNTMYAAESISPYLLWYADYTAAPELNNSFAMWQYTAEGSLPGISSDYIDLNMAFVPK